MYLPTFPENGFPLSLSLSLSVELPENWTDTRETILEGILFNLRHLGMTLVDQPKGEDLSAAAVKRIVATAKASGKKPQKVALKVSPQGIVLYDSLNNKLLENVSIHRISYCTVDKLHNKVFAYIAQNTLNGTLECHAYLCSKRKVAQAVALTVAQAFTVALELWRVAKEGRNHRSQPPHPYSPSLTHSLTHIHKHCLEKSSLFEFFSLHLFLFFLCLLRLAVSRTNPQVLDIGVTPQDWLSEPDWELTRYH
uniref:PID domain-containing protein n=1 Tax=Monopterus albus TaxID=43700 RepID=A0A3Q3IFW9_MONAL